MESAPAPVTSLPISLTRDLLVRVVGRFAISFSNDLRKLKTFFLQESASSDTQSRYMEQVVSRRI